MLIKSTNLANARLMDFFQVMSILNGFLTQEDLETLQLKPYADDFSAQFIVFDNALKQALKTGYTEQVIIADDARDAVLTGFLGTVRSLMYFPDAAVADAAAKIMNIIEKYGTGIQRLPQREETAVITNLMQDLRANSADIQSITGLITWVDKLDEANKAFDALYNSRTEKEAEFIVGLTRTERAAMQTDFENLSRGIDAYAFINGEENYKPLANKINTEIANVQQAIKARATMAKNAAANSNPDVSEK